MLCFDISISVFLRQHSNLRQITWQQPSMSEPNHKDFSTETFPYIQYVCYLWATYCKNTESVSLFSNTNLENSKWKRMSGLYSHVIPVRYRRGLLLVLFQRLFQNPYSKMSFSSTLSFLLIFVLLGTGRRP